MPRQLTDVASSGRKAPPTQLELWSRLCGGREVGGGAPGAELGFALGGRPADNLGHPGGDLIEALLGAAVIIMPAAAAQHGPSANHGKHANEGLLDTGDYADKRQKMDETAQGQPFPLASPLFPPYPNAYM